MGSRVKRRSSSFWLRLAGLSVLGLALATPSMPPRQASARTQPLGPLPAITVDPEIAAFYQQRAFQPLWVERSGPNAAAAQLLPLLERADRHGLDPATYDLPLLEAALARAETGDREAQAKAELLLSQAYVRHMQALRRPEQASAMRYVDTGLRPTTPAAAELLADAAQAPDLAEHVRRSEGMNPVYAGLAQGLEHYRATWGRLPQAPVPTGPLLKPGGNAARIAALRHRLGLEPGTFDDDLSHRLRVFQAAHALPVTGLADHATVSALNRGPAPYEKLIRANLERARALPHRPQGRYVLVDTASAQLWLVENGQVIDRMKTVVGKPGMETPEMAGLIRYASWNPYWILPPDLIQQRARKVLRQGPGTLAAERLQILSDWSPSARPLKASQVDWSALAAGRRWVQLRQSPGPHNMMGRVKFMMPNNLGIYLHDTPSRDLFETADRRHSSGCVRVEDAMRLARWLYGGTLPRTTGRPEERIDLPEPVPVYIAYFTALPSKAGVVFAPDVYRRDAALLAKLDEI